MLMELQRTDECFAASEAKGIDRCYVGILALFA